MENSLPIAGRATLTEEPMNGVRKDAMVVTTSAIGLFASLGIYHSIYFPVVVNLTLTGTTGTLTQSPVFI
jgi:hypothetical protein